MKIELVCKIKNSNYKKDKCYFQKDKKPINITKVVKIDKIVLSTKTSYGEQGANKYYVAYINGGLKPLHIIIKDIRLYTNDMDVLANDNELLKDIEIWNKTEVLLNRVALNKKGFYSKPACNEYINTKISPYNENFHEFKKLTKDKYCGYSVLLLEAISEVKIKYYPQTCLHKFFECNSVECNSIECNSIESKNNKNSLFQELVQIVDWSDDDKS